MPEYEDDEERLSNECHLCGETFDECSCHAIDEYDDGDCEGDDDGESEDAADLLDDEGNDL
jgi:hypothetical protein